MPVVWNLLYHSNKYLLFLSLPKFHFLKEISSLQSVVKSFLKAFSCSEISFTISVFIVQLTNYFHNSRKQERTYKRDHHDFPIQRDKNSFVILVFVGVLKYENILSNLFLNLYLFPV